MASFLPDTDSEDEIPIGWEERATLDGKVFYANHESQSTQWTHPKTGKKKRVAGELPFGWERSLLDDGTVVYVDHMNKKTTYSDPRLAFAFEDNGIGDEIKQRFDSSSSAMQVLHGRDLTGKVAIITGSNCGIGYETAKAFAFHGAHVVMACRDWDKMEAAIRQIVSERSHSKLTPLKCDLASLRSVQQFVEQFEALNLPLHVLICNAGVFALPHAITEDGFERTFQVNHLSHFYLVQLLQERLRKSAPSRVVLVSSESHRFSYLSKETMSEETLSPSSGRNFMAMRAYNDSKLCNVLLAIELNRRLSRSGIFCNTLHPGNMISTSLPRNWWFYRLLFTFTRPFTKSPDQGAATTVYCATALDLEGVGGLYFNNCCQCVPSKEALDPQFSELLWSYSQKMIENALNRQRLAL